METKRLVNIRKKGIILAKIKQNEDFSKSVIEDAMEKIQEDDADPGILSEAAIQSRISSNVASVLRWVLELSESGTI